MHQVKSEKLLDKAPHDYDDVDEHSLLLLAIAAIKKVGFHCFLKDNSREIFV